MFASVPSLSALRAFEAAARHLSLAKAAEELGVTPSAMSHLVKTLESQLGQRLFLRKSRSISLSPSGQRLYPGLHAGLVSIRDAIERLRERRHAAVLTISTPPSFTGRWLASRIFRFAEEHPGIDLRISATPGYVDFERDGIDLAIRNMTIEAAAASELHLVKIVDMTLVPVCSPTVLHRHKGFKSKTALRNAPLIHDETLDNKVGLPDWQDWLEAARMTGVNLSRGLHFTSPEYALDAAAEGGGVLLTQVILAYDDLRTGRLVMPFEVVLPSARAYYLACPVADVEHPPIQAFRNWLATEISQVSIPLPNSRRRKERSPG